MRATRPFCSLAVIAVLSLGSLAHGVSQTFAQAPKRPGDHGVIPDDELMLVVGTRFVTSPATETSAKRLFEDQRVALSNFNETDHCIDQSALEVAREYFTTLGRVMGKAGHYYFVPEPEIEKASDMCARQHGRAPQAWSNLKTKIVAFGRVVPMSDAPALEEKIR